MLNPKQQQRWIQRCIKINKMCNKPLTIGEMQNKLAIADDYMGLIRCNKKQMNNYIK